MEELEVGEYVRIDNDFRLIALGIGEVIKINQDTIYVKMNFGLPFAFKIENISKHSKNLIDLIEVGDIVNNYIVLDVMEDLQTGEIHLEMPSSFPKKGSCAIYEDEIETILTREQYMQNCYKLEEK